jgi:hypothetical protein
VLNPSHRIRGYDFDARAFLGSLDENGLIPPGGSATPFERRFRDDYFATDRSVYKVIPATHSVVREHELPRGAHLVALGGMNAVKAFGDRDLGSTVVLTTDSLIFYADSVPAPALTIPLSRSPESNDLNVLLYPSTQRIVLMFQPRLDPLRNNLLDVFDANGKRLITQNYPHAIEYKSISPGLERVQAETLTVVGITNALCGLPVISGMNLLTVRDNGQGSWMSILDMHTASNSYYWYPVVAVQVAIGVLGFLLARRYAAKPVWLWSLLALVLGPAILLLLLSIYALPRKVRCPSCGKGRLPGRVTCAHCTAPFTPPPANGTEIFA